MKFKSTTFINKNVLLVASQFDKEVDIKRKQNEIKQQMHEGVFEFEFYERIPISIISFYFKLILR